MVWLEISQALFALDEIETLREGRTSKGWGGIVCMVSGLQIELTDAQFCKVRDELRARCKVIDLRLPSEAPSNPLAPSPATPTG